MFSSLLCGYFVPCGYFAIPYWLFWLLWLLFCIWGYFVLCGYFVPYGYFGYFGYFFVFEAVLYFVAILATFLLNATVCNAMHRVVRTTWKLQFFRWIARVPKWSNSDTTMRILTTPFTDYKKIELRLKPLLLVFECDGCFNCSTSIVMNDLSRRADWSIVEAAKSNYLTETFSSWHDLCFPSTTTLPQLNLMKATANYLNIRFDHKLLTPLTTNFKFFCLLQDFGPKN